MKRYLVELKSVVGIELDDKVIDIVDDNWRKELYDLKNPQDIAKHIAFSMVVNGAKLSQLDGWADQPDDMAKIFLNPEWSANVLDSI